MLPFIEIGCVTSTRLTFPVTFVLLACEEESNYIWTIERLRRLFLRLNVLSQVVVSERDLTLINAITIVFENVLG